MPCRRHARRDARRTTTRTKESPRMRRFLLVAIATLATVALVTPSWATTTITETVPRRIEAPIEKACPFEVTATDRLGADRPEHVRRRTNAAHAHDLRAPAHPVRAERGSPDRDREPRHRHDHPPQRRHLLVRAPGHGSAGSTTEASPAPPSCCGSPARFARWASTTRRRSRSSPCSARSAGSPRRSARCS